MQAKINKHINYVSNHRTSLRTLWWEDSNARDNFASFQCTSWWALLTFRDKWIPERVFVTVTLCIFSSFSKAGWFPSRNESRWWKNIYILYIYIFIGYDLNTSLCWDGTQKFVSLFLNCNGSYFVKEGQVFPSFPTPTEKILKSLSSFPIISLHSPIKRIISCFSKPKFKQQK